MQEKKKQVMRYGESELALIKGMFKGNDPLVIALRKVFLQMPLNALDTEIIINTFKGRKENLTVIRKCFYPELEPEAPLNQLIDLWMTIDVRDKTIEELKNVFDSRELLIDLIEQQLEGLEKVANSEELNYKIELSNLVSKKGKSTEDFYRDIMARNTMITHTETRLSEMSILANTEIPTDEEIKERKEKDSSK